MVSVHTLEVTMKVFFTKKQNVSQNDSYSPSASKPLQVVESWKELGIPFSFGKVKPVSREQLYQIHEKSYVDGVLDLKINNGFGNNNPLVAKALPYVCGSMVEATLHAFKTKELSFSPTSGAHHAHYSNGYGFCTFNFLVLAAIEAHKAGAKKIGIIDLDCHASDGVNDIIQTLGIDYIKVYSFGYCREATSNTKQWIKEILASKCYEFEGYDLVIYNAGVDSHINDSLGGYLTTKQMKKRDEVVFNVMKALDIPVAVSLAGGYQRDSKGTIRPVLDLHDNMFKAAYESLDSEIQTALEEIQNEFDAEAELIEKGKIEH